MRELGMRGWLCVATIADFSHVASCVGGVVNCKGGVGQLSDHDVHISR